MKNDLPITVVESKTDGLQAIKLTDDEFKGIIYTYGKVELDEDEQADAVSLKFEYDVLDYAGKTLTDKAAFEQYIGKILEELIHQGIADNNITYTGGVDENRTKDSEQSDS